MRLVILFAFLAMGSVPVAAQQRDSGDARRVIEQARRGNWFLRVHHDTGAIQGRVTALLRDSAAFLRQRVRYADVTRIERRTRHGSMAGPAALGGGLVLGGFTALMSAVWCEGTNCGNAAIVGGAAGAGIGGAIGGFVGLALNPGKVRFTTIWPDSIPTAPPELPSKAGAGYGLTTQLGLLLIEEEEGRRVPIPAFFSAQFTRDRGAFELSPLGITVAYARSEAAYFGVESGLNYRLGGPVYVGALAGIGADFDKARPVFGVRLGAGKPAARLRLELRANGRISDGFHPSAYAILGYSLRSRAGQQ